MEQASVERTQGPEAVLVRARSPLTRFEWACVGVVAAAFLVRLTFLLQPNVIWDSAWYLMLARSFGETGTFYIRWSEPGAPQYSGYWPPLFPVFVSPLVEVLGASYRTLVLGSILASALLTAAVFGTTRDLYGRPRAFAAMAIVAANPAFYVSDSKGMSESLLAFAVVLTVWAFLKSLDRPAWLPVAGGFALLAYLGKASLGLPFVAAGVVALGAWRVYTRGWRRVVTSKWDVGLALAAIAAFAALAATRTEKIGGVGLGLIDPLQRAVFGAECARFTPLDSVGPHCWALLYPLKVVFVGAFLLVVTLPFSMRALSAVRAGRSERTDALWLATLLPLFAGAIFTTSFYFTEKRYLIDFDNIRYLTPAMVPFLWLVLPHWPLPDEPAGDVKGAHVARRHWRWFGAAVASMFLLMLLNPIAGHASLPRLGALLVLSLVPIGLGLVAYNTQYELVERRVPGGVERRYAPAAAKRPDARILFGFLALLVLSAWFFSAWYVTIGLGLAVAVMTPSPKARVLAMALFLLGSSAPGVQSALPLEEANDALALLPAGTIVGTTELAVFPSAIAPDHVQMRLVHPEQGIPEHVDVLLAQHTYGKHEYENFTRVAGWNYHYEVSPTLGARLWIEENVLGQIITFQQELGIALYVRNGTGLEASVS